MKALAFVKHLWKAQQGMRQSHSKLSTFPFVYHPGAPSVRAMFFSASSPPMTSSNGFFSSLIERVICVKAERYMNGAAASN